MTTDHQRAAEYIKASRKIALIAHISPDGDTLGSALALSMGLDHLGIENDLFCDDPVPELYAFLPGADRLLPPARADGGYDLAVTIDVSDEGRMGECAALFHKAERTLVIDHHFTNPAFGRINLLEHRSATGEIILWLLQALYVPLSQEMATCLFVAISTDTGNFNYSNVTPDTFLAAAELTRAGVDIAAVTEMVFRKRSVQKTRLIASALSGMRLLSDGRISLQTLTLEDFAKTGAQDADTEGLVNFGIECEGVQIAIMARETDEGIKLSLRSRCSVDVGKLAHSLGGGGHAAAAGVLLRKPLERAVEVVLAAVQQAIANE